MFATLCGLIPPDRDYAERTNRLDILSRVLDGVLYDVLPFEFHEERGASGDYIPLRLRRPSVRYPMARIIVDDSLALVFSDGHFPTFDCPDLAVRTALAAVARDAGLNQAMQEAALRGSVGSVAVLLRVLKGRVFFAVLQTRYLTPLWDPEAPDQLASVVEKYKVPGSQLALLGYEIAEPQAQYWFMRRWDADAETWYDPWLVAGNAIPQIDPTRPEPSVTASVSFHLSGSEICRAETASMAAARSDLQSKPTSKSTTNSARPVEGSSIPQIQHS